MQAKRDCECTLHSPNNDNKPPATQITRLSPTEPAPSNTPTGEMKMPDPVTNENCHVCLHVLEANDVTDQS